MAKNKDKGRKEKWPARRPSEPELVLQDDELIDAKRLVPDLSFIKKKEFWDGEFWKDVQYVATVGDRGDWDIVEKYIQN